MKIWRDNLIAPASAFTLTDIVKTYNYDSYTGKLRSLSQKINGQPFIPIQSYAYDVFGRVQNKNQNIADNFYSYNIRGWLTGINSQFFNSGAANIFWCEALSYQNLYSLSLPAYPVGSATNYQNGNIAQAIWQHHGTGSPLCAYRYLYDDLNRITNAKYSQGILSGTSLPWSDAAIDYSMSAVTYDLNGNIKTMNHMGRNTSGGSPVIMDQMTYQYVPNGNRLQGVKDDASVATTNPDFKDDASNSLADYTYDDEGNLITDGNKKITSILYSYLNKPEHIVVTGKGTIDYIYDAMGNKLQKIVKETSGATTRTDYVSGFMYENHVLKNISHEEGRLRPVVATDGTVAYAYDYFIKDHLTNVRSIATAEVLPGAPAVTTHPGTVVAVGEDGTTSTGTTTITPTAVSDYLATHEIAAASAEGALFNNIDLVRANKPASNDPEDVKAATLLGSDDQKRIGTSLMLRVMKGDQFSVSVNSYYEEDEHSVVADNEDILGALLGTLAGGTTYEGLALSDIPQNIQILQGTFNNPGFGNAYSGILNAAYDSTKPPAFLNYIVLDEQMNVIAEQSGAIQIGGAAGTWNAMGTDDHIIVNQAGYLLTFLSSASGSPISFDMLSMSYYRGAELEQDHYYPFGLNIETAGVDPTLVNNIKFTCKELQRKEFTDAIGNKSGIEWEDFGARMQDPQIGRWNGIDNFADKMCNVSPFTYALNNPVKFIDPDGQYPIYFHIRSFAPFDWFGGGIWKGDGNNRGFSTVYAGHSSRIRQITSYETTTKGSTSSAYGNWSHSRYGATAFSDANIENDLSFGNRIYTHLSGDNDAFVPGIDGGGPTHDIDVWTDVSVDVTTNKDGSSILNLTGELAGDGFPSSEVFVRDANNNSIFLGVGAAKTGPNVGPFLTLAGDKKEKQFNINVKIGVDKDGKFTGVYSKGKDGKEVLMSISEWNRQFETLNPK